MGVTSEVPGCRSSSVLELNKSYLGGWRPLGRADASMRTAAANFELGRQ